MTLSWKICTRSLLPSTTLTCTFTSSPGPKAGRSLRRYWLSTRSVDFMARSFLSGCARVRWGRQRIGERGELFQQLAVGVAEAAMCLDQVGTVGERAMQRLCAAPSLDPRVVASTQHLRHLPPSERCRPREVRLLQETRLAEALVHGARRVAHRSGKEAD